MAEALALAFAVAFALGLIAASVPGSAVPGDALDSDWILALRTFSCFLS